MDTLAYTKGEGLAAQTTSSSTPVGFRTPSCWDNPPVISLAPGGRLYDRAAGLRAQTRPTTDTQMDAAPRASPPGPRTPLDRRATVEVCSTGVPAIIYTGLGEAVCEQHRLRIRPGDNQTHYLPSISSYLLGSFPRTYVGFIF